jgi:hypothetical protein
MAIKQATCVPHGLPPWSRQASIGDCDGAIDKRSSSTEGVTPYAYSVYQELRAMRGSAYTQKPGTLVHVENLAIARMHAAVCLRAPEKIRANANPGRSDEKLDYWVDVLGVPVRDSDQRWQIRERCAAHYKAAKGPTLANVTEAVSDLLGDAFIEIQQMTGADLANPPTQTFWPGINPGPPSYDLGGGAWLSERCRLIIVVEQPDGMSNDDFLQLMNVQLFELLDPMLPCWTGWEWVVESDGFFLDLSSLDLEGLTPT